MNLERFWFSEGKLSPTHKVSRIWCRCIAEYIPTLQETLKKQVNFFVFWKAMEIEKVVNNATDGGIWLHNNFILRNLCYLVISIKRQWLLWQMNEAFASITLRKNFIEGLAIFFGWPLEADIVSVSFSASNN